DARRRAVAGPDAARRRDWGGWTCVGISLGSDGAGRTAVRNTTGPARSAEGAQRGLEGGKSNFGWWPRLTTHACDAGRVAGGVDSGVADGRGFAVQELCATTANAAGLSSRTPAHGADCAAAFHVFNTAAATKLRRPASGRGSQTT